MSADVWQIIAITLIVFISSIIQSSTGIGFAIFATATLAFFLDAITSAALISVSAVVFGAVLSFRMRKHINFAVTIPAMVAMAIARVAGIVILMNIDEDISRLILGVILILFAVYFCFFSNKVKIKPTPIKGFVLGLLAGFLGGMYSMTGPFAAIYFYSALEDKHEYAASMNLAFLPSAVIGFIVHCLYGNITSAMLPACVFSCAAILAGTSIGLVILDKINKKQLSNILYVYMAVAGSFIFIT